MPTAQIPPDWAEQTQVPVRGDCGHVFVVPVARFQDGADFTCSVCGATDRIDGDALADAREQLAAPDQSGNALAVLLRKVLDQRTR